MTPANSTTSSSKKKTQQKIEDYLKSKASPSHFIDNFCWIQDENTGTFGRFRLWPYQKQLLEEWIAYRLNVDLKARQLGISWLACAFALWLANFHDNITILLISKSQDKAQDLIRKVKFMYQLLPEHLKKNIRRDNLGSVVWENDAGNNDGSRIMALASTPGAGVGYTATLIICDEWGEQDYAEELYSSYKPTIDMGGRFIGIGTGNNVGSFYHEIWTKARLGENGFHAHFLRWSLRPGRDDKWYQETLRSYPNQQEFFRQYPNDEVQAFIAAGGCPFTIDDLNWYLDTYGQDPIPSEELKGFPEKAVKFATTNELHVWEEPKSGFGYLVTFDQATGKEEGDYHAFQIIKLSNMEQVAEFQSKCDTDLACELAYEMAVFYNLATLLWESTGVGHAATNIFTRIGYVNMYEHETFEEERREKMDGHKEMRKVRRLGWPASRANNYARDTDLIAFVREHSIILHSRRVIDEMKGFVKQPDGSYGASGRAHDDMVTSLGMGLHVAMRLIKRVTGRVRPTRTYKKRKFKRENWR